MNLEVVAQILQDANLGRIGQDIFIHYMPAETKRGIMLRLPLTGVEVNHYMPGFYKSRFQVIVREQRIEAGETLSHAVVKALYTDLRTEYVTPRGENLLVHYIHHDSWPIVYPLSDGNAREWSINFDCCFAIG